jgi:hypothetical protein
MSSGPRRSSKDAALGGGWRGRFQAAREASEQRLTCRRAPRSSVAAANISLARAAFAISNFGRLTNEFLTVGQEYNYRISITFQQFARYRHKQALQILHCAPTII